MYFYFFFNDTATTEIYTLSLHDALPISTSRPAAVRAWSTSRARCCPASTYSRGAHHDRSPDPGPHTGHGGQMEDEPHPLRDRKSTRLNSSHANISYAVFCLKKKTSCTAT